MKRVFILFIIMALSITANTKAQVPEKSRM